MAGMITDNDSLKNLRTCAGKLAFAAESLAGLFEEECVHLKRSDQVARLKTLHAAITEHIEKTKYDERGDAYSYSGRKIASRSLVPLPNISQKHLMITGGGRRHKYLPSRPLTVIRPSAQSSSVSGLEASPMTSMLSPYLAWHASHTGKSLRLSKR